MADRKIVQDERPQIAAQLRAWIGDAGVVVIISTGGTGLTGRDVTVEAHRDVYEKEIDAFGTVFTHVSMAKIGTRVRIDMIDLGPCPPWRKSS